MSLHLHPESRLLTATRLPLIKAPIWLLAATLSLTAQAENIKLTATPDKCVSLRKGQVCYTRVKIRWRSEQPNEYCLWIQARKRSEGQRNQPTTSDKQTGRTLHCWPRGNGGEHLHRFASQHSTVFELRPRGTEKVVATTSVSLAWVYRQRRRNKPSWRLF